MVFGARPVDLRVWQDDGGDLAFVQDTSISGKFTKQWKLRTLAEKATPKEIAKSKSRGLSAQKRTLACNDVQVGDSVIVYRQIERKSATKSRGRVVAFGMNERGANVNFQSRTFKVAHYKARNRQGPRDVVSVVWGPSARLRAVAEGRSSLFGNKEVPGGPRADLAPEVARL